jgi:hypothetical protein
LKQRSTQRQGKIDRLIEKVALVGHEISGLAVRYTVSS